MILNNASTPVASRRLVKALLILCLLFGFCPSAVAQTAGDTIIRLRALAIDTSTDGTSAELLSCVEQKTAVKKLEIQNFDAKRALDRHQQGAHPRHPIGHFGAHRGPSRACHQTPGLVTVATCAMANVAISTRPGNS